MGAAPVRSETIAYVAHVSGQIIGGGPAVPGPALPDPDAWRRGDLFVRASQSRGDEPLRLPETDPAALQDKADLKRSAPPRASLFVPRTDAPR